MLAARRGLELAFVGGLARGDLLVEGRMPHVGVQLGEHQVGTGRGSRMPPVDHEPRLDHDWTFCPVLNPCSHSKIASQIAQTYEIMDFGHDATDP